MSLLWRDSLRIVLCPDKVILLGLGKGVGRKIKHKDILPCMLLPGGKAWQAPLFTLEHWLEANKPARADVTVILSNHFVRYALMPFSEDVTSFSEEQALARVILENIYGDAARQWQIKICSGGYGEARLIAAINAELWETIARILALASLKLNSLKPYLMSAFNGLHKQVSGPQGVFAVAEPGQLVTIAFRDNLLLGVRRTPVNGSLDEQLPNLLHREVLLGGLDAGAAQVYVHVAGRPDFNPASDGGMNIQILRHVDKDGAAWCDDPRFDMACVG